MRGTSLKGFLLFSVAQQLRVQGRFGFRNVQLVKTEEHSLGIGSYGAVYRVKCDQLVCAAKVLHPILLQTRDPAAYRIVQRFEQEIEFLSGLRHPNVIQYLGSCRDPESGLPVMFMELMDESLTSFLERPANPPPLPLHIQINIAHDVAQALSHLHRHEVLHRDLSSNNVLLIGNHRAKVTDFGMAKLLGTDPRLTPTYCPGTNGYMSPEALADPPSPQNWTYFLVVCFLFNSSHESSLTHQESIFRHLKSTEIILNSCLIKEESFHVRHILKTKQLNLYHHVIF